MRDRNEQGHEPLSWLIYFHTSTGKPWLDRLIPGRLKHVSAAGWVSEPGIWIFYDAGWRRTSVKALGEEKGEIRAAALMRDSGVLKVPVNTEVRGAALMRAGFWCVPAVKHLIGSRSGALRPDRLWRDLISAGAEIIQDVR